MAKKEIERGVMVSAKRQHELQNKPGGSNVGKYNEVSSKNFAGNACGLPGSYPINTIERARAALSYAHNAKNPSCIKEQVYKKYPQLKKSNDK